MYSDPLWDKQINSYRDYQDYAGGASTTGPFLTKDEMYWQTMQQQFRQLYNLQKGWDGGDAEAPDADVLDSVAQLMSALIEAKFSPPDRIVPSLEGGVVIEWHSEKRYLEIEIEKPYCGEVMDVKDRAAPEHYDWCWRRLAPDFHAPLRNWPEYSKYPLSGEHTARMASNVG